MNTALRKTAPIILASLALAFIFNFLFFDKYIGVSIPIFTFILLGCLFFLGRKESRISLSKNWWLIILIMFFATMPAIRDNEFLTFLNILATLGLLMILAYQLVDTPAWLMKIHDYFSLGLVVPFRMLGGAFSSLATLGQFHSNDKNREITFKIIKGFFMAIPVLIVFGLLFSHADLAFSQLVSSLININISEYTFSYLFLLAFSFFAGLSFLSYIFFPKQFAVQSTEIIAPKFDKGLEVLVFLGLIGLLFLIFIIFQITYLFGGETNIINAGFTYAEYARRGFFELLMVAVLSILVLLYAEKHAGLAIRSYKFLIPALLLILEVAMTSVAAFKRLSLYIDVYGMTHLRFYVSAFIVLIFALLVLLAIKFIKNKPEQFFTFGSLLSVIAFLIAINFANPDALIIKKNIELYNSTKKLDVIYLQGLSADAMTEKLELYNILNGNDQKHLHQLILMEKQQLQNSAIDWQSANLSRYQALQQLQNLPEKE
jgi:hypothetical protein